MRRAEKDIKDRQTIESILERATVCRLGLCSHGLPYVVPLSFGYEDQRLYFHSAPEGRKIDTIKENPNVCFEVDVDEEYVAADVPCDWTVRYRSVIGFGKARLVKETEQKRKALDVILGHYGRGPFAYAEGAADKVAVIEVQVESLTGKHSG
jgi:nitroimidazol reductase NimA-like FMN-containing flavoprotein (pyridoxamine 5'-phosphate oxidase superfamily)